MRNSFWIFVSGDVQPLSINEKCMQDTQAVLNFNELCGSNVMKLCQMLTEIKGKIHMEPSQITALSVNIL